MNSRSHRPILLPLAAALAAGCIAPVTARATDPLVAHASLAEHDLTTYWSAHLPLVAGDRVREAFLVDDSLYVATADGLLYALAAEVGLIRWAEKLAEPGYRIHRPQHVTDPAGEPRLVVPTTSRVYILDRYAGHELAGFAPGIAIGGDPIAVDRWLFVGGADGRFHAFLWTDQPPPRIQKQWEVLTGSPVTAAPLLFDRDKLLFATLKGQVVSCFATDKALHWTHTTRGAITGDPAIDDTGIYVASHDRSLYKLDPVTGGVLWRHRAEVPLRRGPIVLANTVYLPIPEGGLTALESDSGVPRWRVDSRVEFAAHDAARDLLFHHDGKLLLVDHHRGAVIASLAASGAELSLANTADEAVYLFAADGRIQCVRPSRAEYLRARHVEAARRRLTLSPGREPADDSGDSSADSPDGVGGGRGDSTERDADDPLRSPRDRRP